MAFLALGEYIGGRRAEAGMVILPYLMRLAGSLMKSKVVEADGLTVTTKFSVR